MPIGYLLTIATDAAGNVYFTSFNCVFELDRNGVVIRVAANSRAGYSGDGGPATNAQLSFPWGVAVDRAGNLFIADTNNNRIRKVSPDGIINTVAGDGTLGFSGNSGRAAGARLSNPTFVAVDAAGNLFIAESYYYKDNTFAGGNRIRRVSPDGMITTVAGNDTYGFSGDGGPATSAQLSGSRGISVDGAGNVYIADSENSAVRILRPTDGALTSPLADCLCQQRLYCSFRRNRST